MEEIDNACRRVPKAGSPPRTFCNSWSPRRQACRKGCLSPEHRRIARDITAETFVLLKNEGNLLPLQKKGKIALIG